MWRTWRISSTTVCVAVRPMSTALVCAAALSGGSHAAHAQGSPAAAVRSYTIDAGPLRSALDTFAAQAGVSVSYVPGIVDGKVSPELAGSFTVEQAMTRLLAGSGLYAQSPAAGTYVILRMAQADPESPLESGDTRGATQLPAIPVTANAITGLGYHDEGFVAQTTRSATRTDTPIAELAQSVEVVTLDVMRSQQTQSVRETLGNVSGVTTYDEGTQGLTINVRGSTAPILKDGDLDVSGYAVTMPIAAIERVEVLKGANSILAGPMSPGGVINIVTKKPQADPVHDLTMQTGSNGDWLTSADLAGALTPDRLLTYRFVLSGEAVGQKTDGYDGMRDFYLAPSLGFDYRGTHLIVGLEHDVQRLPQTGFTVLGPQGPYPLDTPIGRPDDRRDLRSTSLFYDFAQELGRDWTFRSKARYVNSNVYSSYYGLADVTGLPGTASDSSVSAVEGTLVPVGETIDYYSWSTEQSVTGKIRTGPVSQTVTAGFSYGETWATAKGGTGDAVTLPLGDGSALPPINMPTANAMNIAKQYDSNPFLQDQIQLGRLHVLASVGHPREWSSQQAPASAWTPNLGVLYALTDSVAVYLNVLHSFFPQASVVLPGGDFAPPRTGSSTEAGAKFSLFDDRLTMTAAVFRATEKNAATLLPDGSGLYTLSPGSVRRGVEFDATGRLLPGLNLIASYTYSSYVSVVDGFSQLPKHQGSFWMTYDLQGERWHGWGGGVGVRARSGYGATSTAGAVYPMPGQARTDASVYYHAKKWSATLGVKNVFNRRLYGDYATSLFVAEEPGRLTYLTGVYHF
jgi:iron complex outermembrane receptor protein